MNPNSIRRAIGVACDIAADVATGLSKTFCAATSTLAIAVLPDVPAAHDPGHDPAAPSGPPRIPAALPPMPPPPSEVLDQLAAFNGPGWFDRLEAPVFSPWQVPEDWQAPDDASEMDGWDGPVSP